MEVTLFYILRKYFIHFAHVDNFFMVYIIQNMLISNKEQTDSGLCKVYLTVCSNVNQLQKLHLIYEFYSKNVVVEMKDFKETKEKKKKT